MWRMSATSCVERDLFCAKGSLPNETVQFEDLLLKSNDELKEYNCYINDEIYDFLGTKDKIGIANEYIRKVPILPEEKIIIRTEIGEEVR